MCIATEDIVGPIRNGGIGTTYTHLAFLLAEAGHDVTILYLRGEHSESGNVDYWVEWYRLHGVRFVPVDMPGMTTSPAQRWIQPMYALYLDLQKDTYDLVHASEWRGSAYLCLLAKQQGLAFRDTIFCIKTSSPWLWNREQGLRTVDQASDLVKMYAERRSVELADLVIGGSAYLLRWMLDHGYHLPAERTFVQPNVVKPVDIPEDLRATRPAYGSRVPVKEIVFFGRLEHRKGLDLFCEAIHNLLKGGRELPPVTFMGKFGTRIPSHPELTTEQYIHAQAENWPMDWQILSEFGQSEAITYLLGEGRLAVMPSVAENSTLTVYETTHFAIPFIASDVGGTSELITKDHRKAVLMDTHPVNIAAKLGEALDEGGMVAAPSYDNDANLGTWVNFHSNLSVILDHEDWPPKGLQGQEAEEGREAPEDLPGTSVCLVLKDDPERIGPTVDILLEQARGAFDVVLVDDGSESPGAAEWLQQVEKRCKEKKPKWKVFRRSHFGLSAARNFAAGKAKGSHLLFIDPEAHPRAETIDVLTNIAARSGADVLLPFYDCFSREDYHDPEKTGNRVMFLAGDPAFTFYNPQWRSPVVYVRKAVFEELGGFSTDYKIPAAVEEFLAAAVLAGKRVESVPEGLVDRITDYPEHERYYEDAALFRTARPYIRNTPLCYQPLLMAARSMEARRRVLRENNKNLREERKIARKERDWQRWEKNRIRKERDRLANMGPGAYLKHYLRGLESKSPHIFAPVFRIARFSLRVKRKLHSIFKRGHD